MAAPCTLGLQMGFCRVYMFYVPAVKFGFNFQTSLWWTFSYHSSLPYCWFSYVFKLVSIYLILSVCHSHSCHGYLSWGTFSKLIHGNEFNHALLTSTETAYLQKLRQAFSSASIFTFMVSLVIKTKLPVNEMQNSQSWMLPQSQKHRFSRLFHISCVPS